MRTSAISAYCVLVLTLVGGLAGPARGVDGVFEINQAKALAGGVSSDPNIPCSDAAGFPVTICEARSYRLTSNLTVSDPNVDGIEVLIGLHVSIDLNGFTIAGPISCTGSASTRSCDPGTGRGIDSGFSRLTVRDGSVRGFGSEGIRAAGSHCRIRNVTVSSTGATGIFTGSRSLVSGSIALATAGNGIRANGIVENNVAFGNRLVGIDVSSSSSVIDNAVTGNGGDGIFAGAGCHIRGNNVRSNTGFGMTLDSTVGSEAAYRGNTITSNTAGTVSGGFNMGDNFCNGTATCP